jgi:anti-sigma-K factor RskA
MSVADLEDLLGAYALGALDEHERWRVERLLDESPAARAELARHNEVVEHLATMASSAPPGDLWRRINEHIEASNASGTPSAGVVDLGSRRSRPRWARSSFTALAAAAVAAVLAIGLIAQTWRVDDLTATIAAQDQESERLAAALDDRDAQIADLETVLAADPLLLAAQRATRDPQATLVSLAADEVGAAQMTIVIQQDGRGYVTSSDLAPLDPALTYQLWAVMGDGRIISAAVLGNQPGVDTFVVDLENLVALAITEEVTGGVVASENEAVIVGVVDA